MPRKAKRAPVAPYNDGRTPLTQTPAAPTGMAYGAHQAAVEAQQEIPLPASSPAAGPAPGAQLSPDTLAIAAQHPFQPVDTYAPTRRPHEPITTGLASGPGPGPEVLNMGNHTADVLDILAATTGDVRFEQAAYRARSR